MPTPAPVALGEDRAPVETEETPARAPVALAVAPAAELVERPLAELHELAREHGVPRYRMLRKDDLVEALSGEAPPRPAPRREPPARPEPEPAAPAEPEPPSAPPRRREVRVSEIDSESVDVLDAMQHLVRQLSSSAATPSASALEEIVGSPTTKLLVARDADDGIVGMLTLVVFRIPTGVRAWIEDVVVDEQARGGGVGEALTREAIEIAGASGARTVDLTSRREREAANRMYRKVGFARRQTTVYRIEPSE